MAIKVVEHRLRRSLEEMDEARESLLSASVSHPNVVRPLCHASRLGCLRNTVCAQAGGHGCKRPVAAAASLFRQQPRPTGRPGAFA